MKITKAKITAMVVSCRATKSGKGYMLTCVQSDSPFMVFSKEAVVLNGIPKTVDLEVDISCFIDRETGELKEFIAVS